MVNTCCVVGCKTRVVKGGPRFHRFPKETVDLNKWINIIQDFDPKFKYKSANTVICGNHFAQTDYTLNIAGTKQTLKKSSVPSIFPTCVTLGINLNEDYVTKQHLEISSISENTSGTSLNDIEVIDLNIDDIMVEKSVTSPIPENAHNFIAGTSLIASENEIEVVNLDVNNMVSQDLLLTPVKKPRKRKCFFGDFKSESEIKTPSSRKKYWIASQEKVKILKNKNKKLRNENLYLRNKIKNIEELIEHLKDKNKISDNCFTMLKVGSYH